MGQVRIYDQTWKKKRGTPQAAGNNGANATGDPVPASDATVVYDMRDGGNQDLQSSSISTIEDARSELDNITFSGNVEDPYITEPFGDGTKAFGFPIYDNAGVDVDQQNMEIIPHVHSHPDYSFDNDDPPPGSTVYLQYKRWFGRTSDDSNGSARGNVGDWRVHHLGEGDDQGPGGRKWIVWKRAGSLCADRIDILKQHLDGFGVILANSLVADGLNEDDKTGTRIADDQDTGSDRIILGQGDESSEITAWWPDAYAGQVNTFTYKIKLESSQDAQDGEFAYWVNGTKYVDITGLATCAQGLNNPTLGFPTWRFPPQDQTEYFWDAVFWVGGAQFPWKTWSSPAPADVQIPSASGWTDQGEVLPTGGADEWDEYIFGAMNQVGVQKKSDTLYLYYVGADGLRDGDDGPANRRLGVATSTDGLSWTKAQQNPIVDDANFDDPEEGVFSGGLWSDGDTIQMMLGVMEGAQGAVDGSGDLYTTTDGVTVSLDTRDVIDPDGAGPGDDERFPLAAYEHDGTKYVFYAAIGGDVSGFDVVVASGPSWDSMDTFTNLRAGGDGPIDHTVNAGGEVIKKSSSRYLLPTHDRTVGDPNRTVIYSFDPSDPHTFSNWTEEFNELDADVFGQELQDDKMPGGADKEEGFLMYLDRDLKKWFLFYDVDAGSGSGIRCLTAPMNTV